MARIKTDEEVLHTCDTLEDVHYCLQCPLDDCVGDKNCPYRPSVIARVHRKHGRPRKVSNEQIKTMILNGWTGRAICRELGISESVLCERKKELQIAGELSRYCKDGTEGRPRG
jgi:hypothetical protein